MKATYRWTFCFCFSIYSCLTSDGIISSIFVLKLSSIAVECSVEMVRADTSFNYHCPASRRKDNSLRHASIVSLRVLCRVCINCSRHCYVNILKQMAQAGKAAVPLGSTKPPSHSGNKKTPPASLCSLSMLQ